MFLLKPEFLLELQLMSVSNMKDPVLAKLVDLTDCSHKIEQCLHELGIGSYGTLLMLTRELNGHAFRETIMEAKLAKSDPLSEEEKENLLELHALTISMKTGLWEEYRTWMTWGFAQGSNSASKRKEPGSDPLAPAGSRRDQLKSAATTAMALVPVEILEAESGQTLSTTGLQDKERRRKALAVANLLMMIERAGAGSLL